jgi:RNA polymerase sigma-70 factor (ECF subfamily)
MAPSGEDWAALLERLLEGDRLALARLTRLVASFLARWNAWDFRDDWDDIIQEVLLAAARAMQQGQLRERQAVAAYLKSTARHKFADRLRSQLRYGQGGALPWEDVVEELSESPDASELEPGLASDVQAALARLSPERRDAVMAVYVQGKTYDEAAADTGIPLGSLKRYLREGLEQLRRSLGAFGSPP